MFTAVADFFLMRLQSWVESFISLNGRVPFCWLFDLDKAQIMIKVIGISHNFLLCRLLPHRPIFWFE